MNQKEKSLELVYKYCDIIAIWNLDSSYSLKDIAKQCALICVDEMIDNLNPCDTMCQSQYNQEVKYWQEVKIEIEKL